MKKILFACLLVVFNQMKGQNIVALWNYNTIAGAPASPTADIGVGSCQAIGSMVVATAATGMDPILNNGCGIQNGTNPGAWALTATPGAADESSGVQFNASTVGYQNIMVKWDQRWSNTATNTVRLQYTIDGTTWVNFTMTPANTSFCNGTLDNGRFQNNGVGDQYRRITVNLSSITTANNNPSFGVRMVAAQYQSSAQFRQTSNSSLVATGGTWRFDNVSIQGQANVSIVSASNFTTCLENVGSVSVPITISNANSQPVELNFGLSVYTDASENLDFTWTNTLVIPANSNGVFNLPIAILDDSVAEKAERIIVKILSGTNANISSTNNYQIIFVRDNDYVAPSPNHELNLSLLTSYSNGVGGSNSAEIVAFDPSVDRLYIANSLGGKMDIVDFSNPASPNAITSVNLSTYGGINSLVANDSVVACAIEAVPAQGSGKVVFFDYNGVFINQVDVGAMPDMITFNRDKTKLLTANEGEPNADYSVDPVGSVSIIDLSPGFSGLSNANVATVGFSAFNGQDATLRAQGIRIFTTSASVAQDLEPEYIAISDDNTKAYVTLQENNALVTIDLTNNAILSLKALGYSSYNGSSGNALDASDQSGAVLITGNLPIQGAFMPDAITYHSIGGQGLIFSANEGDSREFASVVDANRISSAVFNSLDPIAFPDAQILRNNKFLGRLSALRYSGDTDGDGDFDELHVLGGRSFSIWNAQTGSLVFDSKDLIEQITANHPQFGSIFNASNATGVPAAKNRSDDKGPEPEGIVVSVIDGRNYAFVSLERIGGVMVFNVDNPASPAFVGYYNNRSTTSSGPDLGAEGIIFIPANQSPNNKDLVILANEVSSTLSIYEINTCESLSIVNLMPSSDSICQGDSALLVASISNGVTVQWKLNGLLLPSAVNDSLFVNASGQYSVSFFNPNLSCASETDGIQITVSNLPLVDAGPDLAVCLGDSLTLVGSGATQFVWNNSIVNGQPFAPTIGGLYVVTGTDALNCSATDTMNLTLNSLPTVVAGPDFSVCFGDTVTLSGSGASVLTWDNGVVDGQPFVPQASGAFSLLGTDSLGCSARDTLTVTVNQLPVVVGGQDQSICEGDTVTLLASGAPFLIWDNGVINGQAFVTTSSGVYTVTGTDSFSCTAADTVVVAVSPLPIVDAGPDALVCSDQFPYTLIGTSNGQNIAWSNGSSTLTTTISAGGIYTLTASLNGCTASDEVVVTEQPCTSLESPISEESIYPNPFTNQFYLSLNSASMMIKLVDLNGKVVKELVLNEGINSIETSELPVGVYFLIMIDTNYPPVKLLKF